MIECRRGAFQFEVIRENLIFYVCHNNDRTADACVKHKCIPTHTMIPKGYIFVLSLSVFNGVGIIFLHVFKNILSYFRII